ncbi:SDR family oxidoreductase [Silvibacterium dinghuense]|uniref:SDR family oxidoreductase n=1 Tax=Silvibacterium dinghuense TaxID=1560006 RepID=A0A4Q1SJB9_9BACT|nr:SDR family oxidoreductase [Silvibacterium dinghuense]RXS97527.1 SDR family oxidoreductase [Silvibacterium dinghuense]GGG99737.1 short-chain dehydrogenase [Silvibacterium dinghuense]
MPKAAAHPMPTRILCLGATSAIAEATLRIFAERGASLFLVARSAEKLEAVAADLRTRGAAAVATHVMDLDDTAAHPAMLTSASLNLGTIEMALLAHGTLGDQPEAEVSYPAAEAILGTNFLAPVSLITWLANYFEQSKQGTLAVISSVAGDRGRKSNYVYGSAKGALSLFLDGVRNRIDRAGVQVLTIKPGFVATPMTAHLPRSPLFASPDTIARGIVQAVEKRKDVVYLPAFWALIMFIIRSIPGRIFKKLNL